jgi:hypothetical protein
MQRQREDWLLENRREINRENKRLREAYLRLQSEIADVAKVLKDVVRKLKRMEKRKR